ncbi:MAG TPA: hypothetical protein VFV88_06885 [Steroidobacteraceae bacterium]|nr:hypothetical protein [Steroidobacteraceae bacterium]
MSEYYLADRNAEERVRRRELDRNADKSPTESQNVKVTLLGDFMFPSSESQGFDPYNNVHGKTTREAWRMRRDRR